MKTRFLAVVLSGFAFACGGPDKPAAPVTNATPAPDPTPAPTSAPLPPEKPADPVVSFGKKAPAAGTKWTDKYASTSKDGEKRTEERKIEIVTSDDKSIQKMKVTLASFEMTLKGKTLTPNKSISGKTLTVEAKADKAEVTDDAGKTNNLVAKFVATRRGPHVGQPLPGLLAFTRALKVGDVLDGDGIGSVVTELTEWRDENLVVPATVKRELQAKATLKSIEKDEATFDVTVKEKQSESTTFMMEAEHTGLVTVRIGDAMVSKANITSKGHLKVDGPLGPGNKKVQMDLPLEATVTFTRSWE